MWRNLTYQPYCYAAADWFDVDTFAGTAHTTPVGNLTSAETSARSATRRAFHTLRARGLVQIGYRWAPREPTSDFDADRKVCQLHARLSPEGPRMCPKPDGEGLDALDSIVQNMSSTFPLDDRHMAYLIRRVQEAYGSSWPLYYIDHLRATGRLSQIHDQRRWIEIHGIVNCTNSPAPGVLFPVERVLMDGTSSWPVERKTE